MEASGEEMGQRSGRWVKEASGEEMGQGMCLSVWRSQMTGGNLQASNHPRPLAQLQKSFARDQFTPVTKKWLLLSLPMFNGKQNRGVGGKQNKTRQKNIVPI